jgi:hypothetical protein
MRHDTPAGKILSERYFSGGFYITASVPIVARSHSRTPCRPPEDIDWKRLGRLPDIQQLASLPSTLCEIDKPGPATHDLSFVIRLAEHFYAQPTACSLIVRALQNAFCTCPGCRLIRPISARYCGGLSFCGFGKGSLSGDSKADPDNVVEGRPGETFGTFPSHAGRTGESP